MLDSHIVVVLVQPCLCVRDVTGTQDLDFDAKASAHVQSLTYLLLYRTFTFSQLTAYQLHLLLTC